MTDYEVIPCGALPSVFTFQPCNCICSFGVC